MNEIKLIMGMKEINHKCTRLKFKSCVTFLKGNDIICCLIPGKIEKR